MGFQQIISEGNEFYQKLISDCKNFSEVSESLLMDIIRINKDTEFGRANHFSEIKSLKDYQKLIPISTYSSYQPMIERMVNGEKDLLTTSPVFHYCKTSGSVGVPKKIPICEEALEIFTQLAPKMSLAVMDNYLKETKQRSLKEGTVLTTIVANSEKFDDKTTFGAVSGAHYARSNSYMKDAWAMPEFCIFSSEKGDIRFLKALFSLIDKDVICIDSTFSTIVHDFLIYLETNWELLCDTIESGIIPSDINLSPTLRRQAQEALSPNKERSDELRKIFNSKDDTPFVRKIWPNLEFICCIGTASFGKYLDKMRPLVGDIPIYHNLYASSEVVVAAATKINSPEYTMLPYTGFFEFIPADMVNEDLETLQSSTLTSSQLEVGKDYELIVTSLSGLYRYRIGDVLTVLGFNGESPIVCYKYRTSQTISMAGEKTSMACFEDAIISAENEIGINIIEYSVHMDYEDKLGRYLILMESTLPTPKDLYPKIRSAIEKKLKKNNPSYKDKIDRNILNPCEIAFVQSETYLLYRNIMVYKGTSENQIKPVRLIDNPFKEKFFLNLLEE